MTSAPSWLADRIAARLGPRPARPGRTTPKHWSFLLGDLAGIALVVLVVTGTLLTIFYRPSAAPVVYDGASDLYRGRELPHAFASIMRLSHDVPGGLLVRRLHAVSAHLLVAAAAAHLLRVVLTGAFRHPRQLNYVLGLVLILAAVASGWTGENLMYSRVAGNSLRVGYAIVLSVPVVGEQLASIAFGGAFPTGETLPRLWAVHVLVLPAVLIGGTWIHLRLVNRHTHTQPPHDDIEDARVLVGEPFWHGPAARRALLTALTLGLLLLFAILVPWSDVTLEGPYRPGYGTASLYPPWYLFWPEGAMILLPAVELDIGPVTLTNVFFAAVALPFLLIAAVAAYPWLGRRRRETVVGHHTVQDPRESAPRLAVVTAVTVFLAILTISAGADQIAETLRAPVRNVIWALRVALLVAPVAVGAGAYVGSRRHSGRELERSR